MRTGRILNVSVVPADRHSYVGRASTTSASELMYS